MMTKSALEKLSKIRLTEAKILFESKNYSGSYYLAGYSIELAIKVCISKLIIGNTIPDKAFLNEIYQHKLTDLIKVAGLENQFKDDCKVDSELAARWAIITKWSENTRYEFTDEYSSASLLDAIENKKHGVFLWITKHW